MRNPLVSHCSIHPRETGQNTATANTVRKLITLTDSVIHGSAGPTDQATIDALLAD